VTTTLPEIPYFDPELRGPRFRSTMREIAAESWLADSPLAKFVLDREAAEFFLRHRATTFPGQKVAEIYGISDGALKEEIDRNILHLNGADHARLRGKVNHAFTPKAADGWRPVMRDFIAELFARVEDDGRCEAVEALCKPYPAMTIATIMGAPLEDAGPLAEWSNWIQRQFAFDFQEHRDRIEQACQELYDHLEHLPRRGLLETLGELEDRELVNLAVNVLVGGIDTTQSQLAQALRLFAEHPAQWEILRADPSLAADAVQAILHHEPITPFTARICLEDIEFRGVTFPRDSLVFVWAGASETFDITAPPAGRPLTFGAGIHYCLGANLARAELQEALAHLAPRMPGLRMEGEPEYESVQGIYGLSRLAVAWS
jgi:cytochrome P450